MGIEEIKEDGRIKAMEERSGNLHLYSWVCSVQCTLQAMAGIWRKSCVPRALLDHDTTRSIRYRRYHVEIKQSKSSAVPFWPQKCLNTHTRTHTSN